MKKDTKKTLFFCLCRTLPYSPLQSLIERGHSWLRAAEALLGGGGRPPLKRLRDCLAAGLRLPVDIPEVEDLRAEIRRCEILAWIPSGFLPGFSLGFSLCCL